MERVNGLEVAVEWMHFGRYVAVTAKSHWARKKER